MIEFDIETRGLQVGYRPEHEMFLAQFHAPEYKTPLLAKHPRAREEIQAALDRAEDYRAWNTKFDLHGLQAAGYKLPSPERWHDGMVMAHIVDERFSAALQARADKLLGEENAGGHYGKAKDEWLTAEARRRRRASKDDGTEYAEPNFSDVPDDIMLPYAENDVVVQRAVCDIYEPAIRRNQTFADLYDMERGVLRALFAAETRGIHFDRDALVALEANLLPQIDAAEERCVRIAAFKNFNPRSPKQVSEALDRLNADTRFMTRDNETKILKVDEENLVACDHPLAEAVLAYRGVHKLWAMVRRIIHGKPDDKKFPLPYLTGEDLVHPSFRQVGARTGRMSCANPNFQQINRDDLRLRYCVRARPGKRLVTCDLEGIELRLLAAFAGEGPLKDMIVSGADPHQHTADMVGLRDARRSTGVVESARDRGKRFNYLQNYGGGIRAKRKWFHVTQEEARRMEERYAVAYPEVARLNTKIEIALEDRGYLQSPWGRRHRVYRNAQREAYMFMSYILQGTAADLFKDSLVKVHDAGVPVIAVVHDEIIAEVDPSDAEEAGHVIEEAFTNHPRITEKIPLAAEAKTVERWSDAKQLDYKPDHEQEA